VGSADLSSWAVGVDHAANLDGGERSHGGGGGRGAGRGGGGGGSGGSGGSGAG